MENRKNEFQIELKYVDGEPVIKDISRVSTPGRRVYSKIKDLERNLMVLVYQYFQHQKVFFQTMKLETKRLEEKYYASFLELYV